MKSTYCLICHRVIEDGLILSFSCGASGVIEGLCTDKENKPVTICSSCHTSLTEHISPSNRLLCSDGEYYWTFGFPGKEREAKSLKSLDKQHVQFLLTMVANPPEELLTWVNQKNEIPLNEN